MSVLGATVASIDPRGGLVSEGATGFEVRAEFEDLLERDLLGP